MLIVHVHVRVKQESVERFIEATILNAQESVKESGIAGFDLLQNPTDPTQFVLVEVFRDKSAPLAHKETPHYQSWRETVESMMAEPRRSEKFTNLFPPDYAWSR